MISQLTKNERHLALIILLALTVCGLWFAIAGRNDPIGATRRARDACGGSRNF